MTTGNDLPGRAQTDGRAPPSQIFISYSHEPEANVVFVRWLANRLRSVGFQVWLDEEQIAAAADFQKVIEAAVGASEHCVFVVTEEWYRREWTQYELGLAVDRLMELSSCRLIAVCRCKMDRRKLGPHLNRLHAITWLPDDAEPDARFWELFCGLSNTAPGAREAWAEKGRAVNSLSAPAASAALSPGSAPSLESAAFSGMGSFAGRPLLGVPGKLWSYFLTDQHEWHGVGTEVHPPIPRLGAAAAALTDDSGSLVVSLYEPIVARFEGRDWVFIPQPVPVLSLALTPAGILGGDTEGKVRRIGIGHADAELGAYGAAIVDMRWCNGCLALLTHTGLAGILRWKEPEVATSAQIELGEFGRPCRLFSVSRPGWVGLLSSQRVGLADLKAGAVPFFSNPLPDSINAVAALRGGRNGYIIHTDSGKLVWLRSDLAGLSDIRFPRRRDEIIGGLAETLEGGVLAWSTGGDLFGISADGMVRQVASDHVAMALPACVPGEESWVARWTGNEGTRVERLADNPPLKTSEA